MFQKMKISDYIKKPLWYRNVYTKGSEAPQTVLNNAFVPSYPMTLDKSKKQILSQTNFLNELSPSAHEIYSTTIRSLRPKYRYDKPTQKLVLNGYEEVERIAMPFEYSIRENKTAYCFGNEIWFGNEGGEATAEKMSRFKSWWNSANMKACISSMGSHLFGTADAAVALYIEDGEIKYKVFGYEDGDNIYKTYEYVDGKRMSVGVRMFESGGLPCVELYKSDVVELWVNSKKDDAEKVFGRVVGEISEDKWILVSRTSHGFSRAPFVYFRERDVPWGIVQDLCNKFDKLLSDLVESGRFFFNPYLFLKGGATSLPNVDFQGRAFASTDPQGDAKILEPPNASSMLEAAFSKITRAILDGTKTVFIHHEDLKGQNDSGAYLRMLCFPEIQWANNFYPHIDMQMKELFFIFLEAVGLVENTGPFSYRDLVGRFNYQFTPCIPQNLLEEATIINNSFTSGTLSRLTVTEEHPLANPQEMARLEADDKRKEETAQRESDRQRAATEAAQQETSSNNNNKKQE